MLPYITRVRALFIITPTYCCHLFFSTTVCRILVFFDNLQACKELLALQLKTMLDLDIAG
jgi:hypothetical protein